MDDVLSVLLTLLVRSGHIHQSIKKQGSYFNILFTFVGSKRSEHLHRNRRDEENRLIFTLQCMLPSQLLPPEQLINKVKDSILLSSVG